MIWAPRGSPSQNALIQRALAACDFPFDALAPSLHAEGKTSIAVEWADLSRSARAGGSGHHHDEPAPEAPPAEPGGHSHEDGVHSVEREVDGRSRVLGLFYLPPYTRVVLDLSLEQNPALAIEVFLAEAAHAVDYHYMVPRGGMRRAVWNALHSIPGPAGDPIPESGDVDHGHSWFDGPAGYSSWVGEAFMEAFVEAFAPSVPVTIQLAHPVSPDMAALVRTALLAPLAPPPPESPPPPPPGRVYRGRYRAVYHDSHARIQPVEWYASAEVAEAAGLRACRTCKPAGATRTLGDDDLLDGCGAGDEGARGLEDSDVDPEWLCLFPPDLVGPVEWLAEQWRALFPPDGPPMPPARGGWDVCKVIDSEGEVQPTVAELMTSVDGARAALGRDLGLGDRLRAEVLNVVEVAGWRTRGSATYNPGPHLCHHTAGAGSALRIVTEGRSDLPGPLSQTNSHRDGRVFLVASGRANHAGPGGHMGESGNSRCSGDEADHLGTRSEGWPAARRLIRAKVANAQIKGRGRGPEYVVRHATWATPPGRKPDVVVLGPEDTDAGIRDAVRRLRASGPGPNPTPRKEDPVQLITSDVIPPGGTAPFAVAPVRVAAYGPAHVSVCADFVPAGATVRLAVADGDGRHQIVEDLPLRTGRTYGFEIAAGALKAGSIHNKSPVPVVVLVEHFLA